MSGSILNMYAHYGVFSAHTLGSKANLVDSILQKLLHGGGTLIFVVASKGSHQGLLGQESRGLNGGGHADAYQKRRTSVQSVGGHHIQHEAGHALVSCAGHQHHGFSGKGAAAAGHVGVDFTFIAVGNDIPEYGGGSLSYVLSGIVLVKGLHAVVAQGSFLGGNDHRLFQEGLQLANQRESGSAFYPELQDTGILAAGTVQLHGQILISLHGAVNHLGQRAVLLLGQLAKLLLHIVRELLSDIGHKIGHISGQLLHLFFLAHLIASFYLLKSM